MVTNNSMVVTLLEPSEAPAKERESMLFSFTVKSSSPTTPYTTTTLTNDHPKKSKPSSRKMINLKDTKCRLIDKNETVQSYTSLSDLLPRTQKKAPWWKRLRAPPSPDFATNLTVKNNNNDEFVHEQKKVANPRRSFCHGIRDFCTVMFGSCFLGKQD